MGSVPEALKTETVKGMIIKLKKKLEGPDL